VALASVFGVVVLLGTLPGASLAANTPGTTTGRPSDPALFVPDQALYQADQLAKTQRGLGAYRDATTRQIVVAMPKAVVANFTAANITSVGAPVGVRASQFDGASIAAMESEVEGLHTRLTGNQAIVSGYDIRRDLFTIRSDASESVFLDFEARYPGKVAYTYGGTVLTSRHDDYAPNWGGAELYANGRLQCTSGYTVSTGSKNYMVTAGHCFPVLYGVYGGTGRYWGRVTSRRDNPNTDVELIGDGSYGPYIYVSSNGAATVHGWSPSQIGASPYCVSGAANGTHCDYTDIADNQTVTFGNGQTTSGLVELAGTGTIGGDSGAPAYAMNGSAFILGSVVGGSPVCSPIPSSCIVYVEPWPRVQSVYGVSLLTA